MNILILSAHSEPASLTNALRDAAAEQLLADGHDVHVGDLYAAGCKASVNRQDFPALPPGERLHVAAASNQATASGTLTADVAQAQAEMSWADALILAFPPWWMSMPAILKGWVDRVYSYGFAHGVGEHSDAHWGDRYGKGRLAGKRAMLLTVAGGWATHYSPWGINGPIDDILFPINHGVLFYPHYDVLPPFVVYQADSLGDEAFRTTSAALRERMRLLFTTSPIPYRRPHAGDYAIPSLELRADAAAPGVTGFAAHLRPAPEGAGRS